MTRRVRNAQNAGSMPQGRVQGYLRRPYCPRRERDCYFLTLFFAPKSPQYPRSGVLEMADQNSTSWSPQLVLNSRWSASFVYNFLWDGLVEHFTCFIRTSFIVPLQPCVLSTLSCPPFLYSTWASTVAIIANTLSSRREGNTVGSGPHSFRGASRQVPPTSLRRFPLGPWHRDRVFARHTIWRSISANL